MRLNRLTISYRILASADAPGMQEINIFVGPNNSGKTSLFKALMGVADYFSKPQNTAQDHNTWLNFSNSESEKCSVTLEIPLATIREGSLAGMAVGLAFLKGGIQCYLRHIESDHQESLRPIVVGQIGTWGAQASTTDARDSLAHYLCADIFAKMTDRAKNSVHHQEYVLARSNAIDSLADFFSGFYYLQHNRTSQINDKVESLGRLDSRATRLASRLHQVMNEKPSSFRSSIDNFMNSVIPGIGEITLRLGKDNNTQTIVDVFFTNNGTPVPLTALGGGVEQVLAIATVLLAERSSLILIEEPESHLHEGAQRRLLAQMQRHLGERQLLIATHSPVFVNEFESAAVFQIENINDRSRLRKAVSGAHQRETLDLLGILPSSLLQTNCVIWVEGATERLLVRRWLAIMAPGLLEHVHYSFMLTAGSLLDYFSIDIISGSRFIDILKICRNYYLICDKDSATEMPSKAFVRRIQRELVDQGRADAIWITDGYEIEWYYPAEAIQKLWGKVEPKDLLTKENEGSPFFEKLYEIGGEEARVKSAGGRKAEWVLTDKPFHRNMTAEA